MPTLDVNGARIHWEERGAGSDTVVFSHGLLFSGRMFDAQVEALADRYRCVTFDHRGQGGSGVTASGYDMDTLAADAAALIEALGCAPCHPCQADDSSPSPRSCCRCRARPHRRRRSIRRGSTISTGARSDRSAGGAAWRPPASAASRSTST
jgi:hypothetical protein